MREHETRLESIIYLSARLASFRFRTSALRLAIIYERLEIPEEKDRSFGILFSVAGLLSPLLAVTVSFPGLFHREDSRFCHES